MRENILWAVLCMAFGVMISLIFKTNACAIDVGDPVFKKDLPVTGRAEVLYEKYDRKAKVSAGVINITGPSGSATVAGSSDTQKAGLHLYMGRLSVFSSDKAVVYVDGGVVDDKDATSKAYILGGGARYLAYDVNNLRISTFAAAHYVPSYPSSVNDFDATLGSSKESDDTNWWEAGAGVAISGSLSMDDNMKIIPYGGFMFSVLRGELKAKINFPTSGVAANATASIEEDQPLIGFAGVSFLINKQLSIRFEDRFIGDGSFTGAIGLAF